MPRKKTKDEFIAEAIIAHGEKYDYSDVNYVNGREKVNIICPEHGLFLQSPDKHLSGQGCRVCQGYVSLTQDSFLERTKNIHGDKYNYVKTIIKSNKDKVEIICNEHGSFFQLPSNHLNGQGCPLCAKNSRKISQRYSKEQFIESAIKVHDNKYDYCKVDYVNSQTKIEIICPIHGSFQMKANSHSNGQGCPKCGREVVKDKITLVYTEFLKRVEKKHGNRYEYVEESYMNYTSKMKIFCSEHGFFWQTPHSHISMNSGCPECGKLSSAISNMKKWSIVLEMFRTTHGDRYKYDESSYQNVSKKMRIKCQKHGWFEQRPYGHYAGYGCNNCSIEEVHEKQKIDFNEFIKRAKNVHGDRYEYYSDDFVNIFSPIHINCITHGIFFQIPRDHYRGSGCPKCISSRGENEVRLILDGMKIKFEEQKSFEDLIHKNKLKCDFYLPEFNTVIEFNGLQHYEPISIFGGLLGLKETQKRDMIKYDYLGSKKIELIIIRYDNDNIQNYLINKLENIKKK
jgi:hypothetical protein